MMRKAAWLYLISLLSIMVVPRTVSANITIEPRLEDPVSGILYLIAINLSTDLMLIAAAAYMAMRRTGSSFGDIPEDSRRLIYSVLYAAVVVAVAGGVIDFACLYEKVDDHYTIRDFSAGVYLVATALIFATIATSMLVLIRAKPIVSLAAAAGIAPLSPLGWLAMSYFTASGFVLCYAATMIALTTAASLGLLVLLKRLHAKVSSGEVDWAHEGREP